MARMYGNHESPSRNFGDSSQFTNCILDSGETCPMTPEVSKFITDKHIEVSDGRDVKEKKDRYK